MVPRTTSPLGRKVERWRSSKSPWRVGFLLLLMLISTVGSARASGDFKNNGGTVNNTGTIRVKNQAVGLPSAIDGVFEYFGANQNVPAVQYRNLTLSGSGTKTTTGGSFTVLESITIAAPVTFKIPAPDLVTLEGTLAEAGYLEGNVVKTVDLAGGTTTSTFGNIGATISWTGSALGLTTVKRTSGVALSGNGNFSIPRSYEITPSTPSELNATLEFAYHDQEIIGRDENTLELWRSLDGGATWRRQGGTVNPLLNTITKANVRAFSLWTASDAANPLGPLGYEWVATAAFTTAVVPSGTVGVPITVVITVKDAYGNFIVGEPGNLAVDVTGANTASLNVVDHGDGTYSVTYTPTVPGTDTLAITLNGNPISGSPYTSTVVSTSAASMALVSGDNQTAPINTQLPVPLSVRLLDAGGNPVAGVNVMFGLTSVPHDALGHGLSEQNVLTDGNGVASTILNLGSKVGLYHVIATVEGVTGSPVGFTATAVAGPAASMVMISGSDQVGQIGQALAQPFVVRVFDLGGNPVSGVAVQFAIETSPAEATGQALSTPTALTGVDGSASTLLTLGNKAGEYAVRAMSAGLQGSPMSFRATAVSTGAGIPAVIVLTSGDNQTGPVSTTLPQAFVVTVLDGLGNPVSGVQVSFALQSSPPDAAGHSLSAAQAATDANGRASTTLTFGDRPGEYIVAATSPSIPGGVATFRATATPQGVGAPALISFVSGSGQSGPILSLLPAPFVVAVQDAAGNPVPGVPVTFEVTSVPDGAIGHALTTQNALTDPNGRASVQLTLGNKVGVYAVHASSGTLTNSPIAFVANAFAGSAAAMEYTSGNGQRGPVGSSLGQPFVVRVVDLGGNAVQGVVVNWSVSGTPEGAVGQSLTMLNSTTDALGMSSAMFQLGNRPGVYTVNASFSNVQGSPVTFSAEAESTPASGRSPSLLVLTSGNDQVAPIKATLPSSFTVQVIDSAYLPVQGVVVEFEIAPGGVPSGASGQSISGRQVVTDASGRASTTLILGDRVGTYTVLAHSSGLQNSPIVFNATAIAGAPVRLVEESGANQEQRTTTTLLSPFVVGVYDEGGNPVMGHPVTFTITSTPAGAAGQSLSATTVLTDQSGIASTFLTLGDRGGTYSVSASAPGSLLGSPVVFTATAVERNAVAMLQVSGDNQVDFVRTRLPRPLVVKVVDGSGLPVDGVSVSFSIVDFPAAATGQKLSEAGVVTNEQGEASTHLTLGSKLGVYTVSAAVFGLSGSPVLFTATALPGAVLTMTSGDGQTGLVEVALANPLVVSVYDASGTPASGVAISWRIAGTPAGATGSRLSNATSLTDQNGRASTTFTLGNKSGSYTVTASSPGLAGSPLTFISYAVSQVSTPAAIVMVGGNNQTAPVSTQLVDPFVVTVIDSSGQPIPGVPVQFAIDPAGVPAGAVGQSLSSFMVTTDMNGRARAYLTLGNKVGTYNVLATTPALPSEVLHFTAKATTFPSAALSYITGNEQRAQINSALPTPLVVAVFDSLGNPVRGTTVMFSLAVVPEEATGQTLSVSAATTDVLGRAATFLTLGNKVGRYEVRAHADGLANSPLRFFATGTPGAAASLVALRGDQQTKPPGATLDTALVVRVVDIGGNAVPGVTVQFAFSSIPGGASGQTLSVSSAVTNEFGEASTVLTLGNRVGTYVVTASAQGVAPVSFSAYTLVLVGDVNADGDVNIADLTTLINHILGKVTLTGIDSVKSDLNSDGALNVLDVVAMQQYLLGVVESFARLAPTGTSPEAAQRGSVTSQAPTSLIRGELEATPFGVRVNLVNDIPVTALHLILKMRRQVQVGGDSISTVFSRANMMSLPTYGAAGELRVVASNLGNIPIEAGSGALFRFPASLFTVDDIDEIRLVVSTGAGIDQAFHGFVAIQRRHTVPREFKLLQNYPNPFNPSTTIEFEVPDTEAGFLAASLEVYNQLGQRIATLVQGEFEGGRHKAVWNGTDDNGTRLASGIYYYRLVAKEFQSAKKMILLR